jgi:Contractile injection system tube protein/LysM domain
MTTPAQPGYGTATITEWNMARPPGEAADGAVPMTVDFDPRSLELSYSVNRRGPGQQTEASGSQRNQAPAQWTSASATLTLTLIFDSTTTGTSVQLKTDKLVLLAQPPPAINGSTTTTAAKVVRFQWGSFNFVGLVTSLSQSIDYFSSGGTPLRATVNLSLEGVAAPANQSSASSSAAPATGFGAGVGIAGGVGVSAGAGISASAGVSASAGISASAGGSASAGVSASVGTTPLTLSAAGDTVQGIAALAGTSVSWKVVAAANNIDNPRILPPGTVLDLSAGVSASAVVGAQVQTS